MGNFSNLFFNLINDFAFVLELDSEGKPGKILEVNNYACCQLGYSFAEMKGNSILKFFDPTPDDTVIEILSEEFKEKNIKASIITKEDIWIDVDVYTHKVMYEGVMCGVILARDITETKRFEEEFNYVSEELVNQRENFQALIDNLTQTQEQLVQSEKMAALGQLIAGVAHEVNTPLGAIKASIGNTVDSLHKTIIALPEIIYKLNKNQKRLFVDLLQMSDLKASAALSTREKRKLRREIAAKLQERGVESADSVADICIYLHVHEKVEPFIPAFLQPETKDILLAVKNLVSIDKNTATISMAVEKAHKVVFALKKFVHHDSTGEKTDTDIIDNIETVLTLYGNQVKQGIQINREFGEIPLILCYPDEINHVWTNIIHNALQAMGQDGILTVRASFVNKEVHVEIADTGSGIEPELKEKIFEPFFTTKKSGEGSGLGLDIVKKIVEKHEGELSFESEVGVGTTFKVVLPFSKEVKN